MGREISQVMGHLGASWLERPKREKEERTDLLIKSMGLRPQDRVADIGAMVTEVLSAMKIVQGFNQESREHGRFREAVERTFAVAKRRVMLRAAMTAVVILLVFGGITMLVWRGAQAVSEGVISGGTIAAFVLTAGLVAGAIGALTEVYGDLLRGAGAALDVPVTGGDSTYSTLVASV